MQLCVIARSFVQPVHPQGRCEQLRVERPVLSPRLEAEPTLLARQKMERGIGEGAPRRGGYVDIERRWAVDGQFDLRARRVR